MEITVPEEIAIMTLPEVAFFPQALLPLHIFEPRYQQMLKQTLATDRLFAVGGIDPVLARDPAHFEPAHRIATVGIVRACQKNDDGTSNLLLQGIARVEISRVVREHPYRVVAVRALASQLGALAEENNQLRRELNKLLQTKLRLGGIVPREFAQFLKTVNDPETFVDLAAFTLCSNARLKQRLLETLDVHKRLQLFSKELRREIEGMKLQRKLQGHIPDDRISHN